MVIEDATAAEIDRQRPVFVDAYVSVDTTPVVRDGSHSGHCDPCPPPAYEEPLYDAVFTIHPADQHLDDSEFEALRREIEEKNIDIQDIESFGT